MSSAMPADWRTYAVADLVKAGKLVIGDGYRAKNNELGSTGLPFARVSNIQRGFDFADADRFPDHRLGVVGDKVSQPGDVVFTSKGTVGRFALVRDGTERFVYSPQLCYWRSLDRDAIDPIVLYYWMTGPEFAAQFRAVAGQTDMADYVSLRDQRRMWIRLPAPEEQRRMSRILRLVDDRAELSFQTAETLRELGRTLYLGWSTHLEDPAPVSVDPPGR